MLNYNTFEALLDLALSEDIGIGDITTEATIPSCQNAIGILTAKSEGVVAGLTVAEKTFAKVDSSLEFRSIVEEGATVSMGTSIAEVEGSAKSILIGERTALNFLQRLSGVATLTSLFVKAVHDYDVRIVDTRKTTPGLRALQKYAVRVGGGNNHRYGLYDGILIKDNHIIASGGIHNAVKSAKSAATHTVKIEVEVETLEQVQQALEAEADILLLDNMSIDMMQTVVKLVGNRAITEASGGIILERVHAVAATGVNLISIGALTHSAMPMDISLNITLLE